MIPDYVRQIAYELFETGTDVDIVAEECQIEVWEACDLWSDYEEANPGAIIGTHEPEPDYEPEEHPPVDYNYPCDWVFRRKSTRSRH